LKIADFNYLTCI